MIKGSETKMKFFIPAVQSSKEAENVYEGIKKFAKGNTGWKIGDERIFKIHYEHEGKEYFAEVGKQENFIGELVIAILKSNTYLICTQNRGALRGEPILVGQDEIIGIEYFRD